MNLFGGGSSRAQTPVDPAALAQAQTQSNIATAQNQAALNNINTTSPFGTSAYTSFIDPNTGQTRYNLNQQLTPELAALFGQQTGLAGNITGAAGTALGQGGGIGGLGAALVGQGASYAPNVQPTADFSAVQNLNYLTPASFKTAVTSGAGGQPLSPVQTSVSSDFPTLVKQAQDAAYRQQTQYLDPQFRQGRQQLVQMLADQGLQPGSEAYDRATGDFDRQQQQAYQSAQNAAVQAGNEQQRALFGQSLAGGQFANQAQNQLFGQGLQLSNLYNQAVLGAAGQQAQAQQGNLARAQTQFQDPLTALTALIGAGTGAYGSGLGGLGAALPAVGAAPTWPLSIPTAGGGPTGVQPTNLGALTGAATQQNQLANLASRQQFGDIGGLGSSLLFGQNGVNSALGLGQGGLFGNLFGTGAEAAAGAQAADFFGGAAAAGAPSWLMDFAALA